MLTHLQIQNLISDTVSRSIHDFFQGKEVKTTHMLDHIFPRERKIRSLIGGLETSMGTRVWEPLAKSFAEGNGYIVCDEANFNSKVPIIPSDILNFIAYWEERKLRNPAIPLTQFWIEVNDLIGSKVNRSTLAFSPIPKGQGVDVILLKDDTYYFFDLKTTQLNAGGGPKFLRNLLCWYTYAALLGIKNVSCFLAFPFDPHKGNFWRRESGKISPLIPRKEAFVGDEFWDVLTGRSNTTEIIESTFKKLGSEGFGQQFSFHFD
ncbi:TdeIII family type II restriction endonuclease [Vibrio parahaemolyticus]|uniref:TdeIII family type II restriction endonuclease n=1 Tax=Vibrio parahaemolyticus TaxID=670 RepID=UPI0015DE8F06|nr:TdeIII family type II restriction endonuclease [Vibrio parahaemolyticus]EHQ9271123.1 TdeIII family type II restriction endonuclease [Vibrio parahaemolyticus]EKB7281807.1 TdeIII family type II restriction endonuclease [Vibrio parahaemolyticus]ELB2920163.1 TdeIII family type II restriction endonuclease [Vibrio parahaemolyticus]MCR9851541.1 TdeIII family type II restriction endonuclease [Vibrio parahaemolyticus]MCX8799679.1 TdeIII family type II restriction endonuclease [Vibrio parahaemolyticu